MHRRAALVAFAAAVIAVPIASEWRSEAAPTEDPLIGLWSAHPTGGEGDPVQFYYFHGQDEEGVGRGLYRYGKVGSTYTNSFDYAIAGDIVTLYFRKTGARHAVKFRVTEDESANVLELADDPRAGGRQRYVQLRSDPVSPHAAEGERVGVPGRMWIDQTHYATGGYGFMLYQLRGAGIDGRGTGWFHRGDFDDWSTESLVYRIVGDRLELQFFGGGPRESTHFALVQGDPASLVLDQDPRDYWHRHSYVDGGPSFGAAWIAATGEL
jgi:hypothetical protein